MAIQRAQINRRGMRDLLQSEGVRKDLEARARRVSSAAPHATTVTADVSREPRDWGRVRVRVVDSSRGAIRREANTGRLSAALDSAGGR